MHIIHSNNPDDALFQLLTKLPEIGIEQPSRNGPVLRAKVPVTTVWGPELDCISTDPLRDANPFLHFCEAMWMLSGANDVKTVSRLAINMMNYSDDGETLHGAYGHRWRKYFRNDQISAIITELKRDPTSRRCVLQMWDGHRDFHVGVAGGRDIPCNTSIYFDLLDGVLNMTVSNRSNDAIWGAYGANVVHMSILHQYVAHQLGAQIGTYYQVSNNLHIYLDNPVTKRVFVSGVPTISRTQQKPRVPLFKGMTLDDSEFVEALNLELEFFNKKSSIHVHSPFPIRDDVLVLDTFRKLSIGFSMYKDQDTNSAYDYLIEHCSEDNPWIDACVQWLSRRPSFVTAVNAEVSK